MRTAAIGWGKGEGKPFEKGFSLPFPQTPIPSFS
jgi:hypothetical protein